MFNSALPGSQKKVKEIQGTAILWASMWHTGESRLWYLRNSQLLLYRSVNKHWKIPHSGDTAVQCSALNLSMFVDRCNNTKTDRYRQKRERKLIYMSQFTCHMLCVTCYSSCVTCWVSHVTCHKRRKPQPQTPSPLQTPPLCTVDWFTNN